METAGTSFATSAVWVRITTDFDAKPDIIRPWMFITYCLGRCYYGTTGNFLVYDTVSYFSRAEVLN
jgi:hypothetical protein